MECVVAGQAVYWATREERSSAHPRLPLYSSARSCVCVSLFIRLYVYSLRQGSGLARLVAGLFV